MYVSVTQHFDSIFIFGGVLIAGNTLIHQLTSSTPMELRIDMVLDDNTQAYAKYAHFAIGSEAEKFVLSVSDYSGNAGMYVYICFKMYYHCRKHLCLCLQSL